MRPLCAGVFLAVRRDAVDCVGLAFLAGTFFAAVFFAGRVLFATAFFVDAVLFAAAVTDCFAAVFFAATAFFAGRRAGVVFATAFFATAFLAGRVRFATAFLATAFLAGVAFLAVPAALSGAGAGADFLALRGVVVVFFAGVLAAVTPVARFVAVATIFALVELLGGAFRGLLALRAPVDLASARVAFVALAIWFLLAGYALAVFSPRLRSSSGG